MDKAHDIKYIKLSGTNLVLHVDGKQYLIDLTEHSEKLARAMDDQRRNFEISPSGYGIYWQDLDEDLSIDGLIGVKHQCPLIKSVISPG